MDTLPTTGGANATLNRALAWLDSRHGAAAASAMDKMLYGGFGAAERRALEDLPAATVQRIRANTGEWLLAEGRIVVDDAEVTAAACVLGAAGLALEPAERTWIEQLAQQPLRLFELVGRREDGRVSLRDALDDTAAPLAVDTAAMGEMPELGSRVGVRIMKVDGCCELSGALYDFPPLAGRGIVAQLREAIAAFGADSVQLQGVLIRHLWLTRHYASVQKATTAAPVAAATWPLRACACGSRRKAADQ